MQKDNLKNETPTDANNVLVAGVPLVDGEYYHINGTKKILFFKFATMTKMKPKKPKTSKPKC